jgi:radical SAM superfamily enzyme YgiQ (UPF0313 family)
MVLEKDGGWFISFTDSIFGLNTQWLEEFAVKYPAKIGLPFSCMTAVAIVNERYANLLSRAGCSIAIIGLEVANENVRKQVFNKSFTNEQFYQATKIFKKNRIQIGLSSIIGIPEVDRECDFETYEINKKVNARYVSCNTLSIYPGTALAARYNAYRDGVGKDEICLFENNYFPVVRPKNMSKDVSASIRLEHYFFMGTALNIPTSVMRFLIRAENKPLRAFMTWRGFRFFSYIREIKFIMKYYIKIILSRIKRKKINVIEK